MKTERAKRITKKLIKFYNLDYSFKFNNCKKIIGKCNYTKKEIYLSKKLVLLNKEKFIMNTILHEIAHAIVGRGNHHNNIWKNKFIQIGGNGKRCYLDDVILPKSDKYLECSNCKKIVYIYRKKTNINNVACSVCCKKYNHGKYSENYKYIIKKVNKNEL